ncbi:protein kinase domain-containing protein [Planctomycetaceae bacterium SH139]
MTSCPSNEVLIRLVCEGVVLDDDLENHLSECEQCQGLLERLESISPSLKTVPFASDSIEFRKQSAGEPYLGRYIILEFVGRGSSGEVFRGIHKSTGRQVAIKIFRFERQPPDRLREWKREARLAGRVNHPNVLQILDADSVEDRIYCVFEWVSDGNLLERIQQSPLDIKLASRYARDIAKGVQALHENRIVHRDIKPSNILIDSSGNLKIADFGIARSLDEPASTNAHRLLGTIGYMAPEQLGIIDDQICEAADIYAIGAVLYAMLIGRGPFAGSDQNEVISRASRGDLVPPTVIRKIPRDLETICLKCLEQLPAGRYRSASELADDLQRYMDHKPILAHRPIAAKIIARRVMRNPRFRISIGAAVFLALGASITYGALSSRETQRKKQSAIQSVLDSDPTELKNQFAVFKSLSDSDLSIAAVVNARSKAEFSPRQALRSLLISPSLFEQQLPELIRSLENLSVVEIQTFVDCARKHKVVLSPTSKQEIARALRESDIAKQQIRLAAVLTLAGSLNQAELGIVTQALRNLFIEDFPAWRECFEPFQESLSVKCLESILENPKDSNNANLIDYALGLDAIPPDVTADLLSYAAPGRIASYISRMSPDKSPLDRSLILARDQLKQTSGKSASVQQKNASPSPAIAKVADKHNGILIEQSCLFPSIPKSDWERAQQSVFDAGFHFTSVRPAVVNGEVLIAATAVSSQTLAECWGTGPKTVEDGSTTVMIDLSESRFPIEMQLKAEQGYTPIAVWGRFANDQIDVNIVGEDDLRISCVWSNFGNNPAQVTIDKSRDELGLEIKPTRQTSAALDSVWFQELKVGGPGLTSEDSADVTYRTISLVRQQTFTSDEQRTAYTPELHFPGEKIHVIERNFRYRDRGQKTWTDFGDQEHGVFDFVRSLGFLPEDVFLTSDNEGLPTTASRWSRKEAIPEEAEIRRRANLVFAAWLLGDPIPFLQEIDQQRDTSTRTFLISFASVLQHEHLLKLLDLARSADSPSERQAVWLMAGNLPNALQTRTLLQQIRDICGVSEYAGVRKAADWAFRQVGSSSEAAVLPLESTDKEHGQIFENSMGQEFVVIDRRQQPCFLGAQRVLPLSSKSHQAITVPKYRFAVALHEVTHGEFQAFVDDVYPKGGYERTLPDHATSEDCPAVNIPYRHMLHYCRWLSEKDGIDLLKIGLPPLSSDFYNTKDQYVDDFSRNLVDYEGYRLPTVEEWQIAARAGTTTDRFTGVCTSELYGYSNVSSLSDTRLEAVGRLMPNPLGLHDIYGNALEMCLRYPHGRNGRTSWKGINEDPKAAIACGGSFLTNERYSASTGIFAVPEKNSSDDNIGFRVARTILDSPSD